MHATFLPSRGAPCLVRGGVRRGAAQYAVSVLTASGSSGPVSDLKRNAHRRLHTFAAPLFARRVLRRRDPTAAAAVNVLFPGERETQRDGERERGGVG